MKVHFYDTNEIYLEVMYFHENVTLCQLTRMEYYIKLFIHYFHTI